MSLRQIRVNGRLRLSLASRRWALALLALPLAGLVAPVDAVAQSLGTFYWRLDPYCNTLVLSVVQEGPVFRLQGYEDQCTDNAEQPTVEGTAILQVFEESIVSLGLSTINGRLIGVLENLPSLNGLWNDSAGNGRLVSSQGVSRSSPFPRRPRGAASFLHIVESHNRMSNISCFSHAQTDGNPEALIVFSHHRGQATAMLPQVDSVVSLYYDDNGTGLAGALSNNVWCLSRNDNAQMPLDAGFSIHVLPRR